MPFNQTLRNFLERVLHRKIGALWSLRDSGQLLIAPEFPRAFNYTLLLWPESSVAVPHCPDTGLTWGQVDSKIEETRVQLKLTSRHSEQHKKLKMVSTLPRTNLPLANQVVGAPNSENHLQGWRRLIGVLIPWVPGANVAEVTVPGSRHIKIFIFPLITRNLKLPINPHAWLNNLWLDQSCQKIKFLIFL